MHELLSIHNKAVVAAHKIALSHPKYICDQVAQAMLTTSNLKIREMAPDGFSQPSPDTVMLFSDSLGVPTHPPWESLPPFLLMQKQSPTATTSSA